MLISISELLTTINNYLFVFFRIAAAMGIMPVFGSKMIPMRIKLLSAVTVTIVTVSIIPGPSVVFALNLQSVLIAVHQVLIGLGMGFIIVLVFATFIHAAQIIAMQMGLGFASMVDPQSGVQVPVLSTFYMITITLVFLSLDGHLKIIELIINSFYYMPISDSVLDTSMFWKISLWAGGIFSGAVKIALPTLASLLLVNIGFGILSRTAPQLNIFAIGFPVSLLFGFVAIFITLNSIPLGFQSILNSSYSLFTNIFTGQ